MVEWFKKCNSNEILKTEEKPNGTEHKTAQKG